MGGGSETKQEATPNPTTEPAYKGATEQILGLQSAMPLGSQRFTGYQPAPVAGLSPFQTAGMNLVPSMIENPAGVRGMYDLMTPFQKTVKNLWGASGPTQGAQSALDSLASSGRVGSATLNQLQESPDAVSSSVPTQFGNTSQVFPGTSASNLAGLQQAVPSETPFLPAYDPWPAMSTPSPTPPLLASLASPFQGQQWVLNAQGVPQLAPGASVGGMTYGPDVDLLPDGSRNPNWLPPEQREWYRVNDMA